MEYLDTNTLSYHDSYDNESVTFLIDSGKYEGYLLECNYNVKFLEGSATAMAGTIYLIDLHDNSRNVTKDPYFSSQEIWFMCDKYIDQDKAADGRS